MSTVVTFEWNPDPAVFAQRFWAVADGLENRAAPLALASQEMQATIRERFETETDPEGNPWEPWAESYKPVAEAFPNIGILQRTGELADVASSSEAVIITNDTVFYRTTFLPSYGLAHEAGLPDREHSLPRRAFLGMDEDTAARIYFYFSEWFDRTIDLYVTRTGRVAPRHAIHGAGGLFITRASVGRSPLAGF